MKNKLIHLLTVILVSLTAVFFIQACKRTTATAPEIKSVDPAFRKYVDGFTTGPVSTETGITVRFVNDVADSAMMNRPADPMLIQFKPSIRGSAQWVDSRTLRFVPEEKLPSNTIYEATLYLSKVIHVPDSLKMMVFNFFTISQDFEVVVESSRVYSQDDLTKVRLTGFVFTADAEELEKVKSVVSVKQGTRNLPVSWSQDADKRRHLFTVDSISRGNKLSKVQISYNGSPLGIDKKGTLSHTIYPLGDFRVTDIETRRFPEEVIIVRFTDPLKSDQEIEGKITMGSFFNYSYIIDLNELHIFPASEIEQDEHLNISAGIVNVKGQRLGQMHSELIRFQDLAPNVRFVTGGTILPSTNGLILPFEAVNLKAVDVRIIRIFQSNIPQFLQVNELSGNHQMSRVGRTVLRKTIPLGQVANPNKWNKYYLDISEMILAEPGAIYRVELTFRKEHSVISCDDEDTEDIDLYSFFNEAADESDDNWEYYSDWYYYDDDYYYYDWGERNNPCSPSYYYGKKASTNILASDIGMMAKKGEAGEILVFATDLITAQPMRDVNIEIINYQLRSLTKGTTDENGMCKLLADGKPFLILASKDKHQSYLRMSDANSLSLSSFDVSGDAVQGGLKGFIYGERGVWRPGDSLFVTLILEDNNIKPLPDGHPVVFEFYNPLGNMIEKRAVTNHVKGFYAFHTATSPDAPTGLYRLVARIGRNTFTRHLRIEAVKPNRLKVDVDPGTKLISVADPKDFRIESQWLHGAIAKNLKVECEVVYRSTKTTFPRFQKYVFDDPAKEFTSDRLSFFSGLLDEKGVVTFAPKTNIENAPGFVNANIETRVYEPGGEFSIDFLSVNVSPYTSYVGLLMPVQSDDSPYLYTNRNYSFKIANVLEDGKSASATHVKLEIYKMDWRYWWSSYDSDMSEFMYSMNKTPVVSKDIAIKNGTGSFSFNVKNEDWGKYYIRVTDKESGHSTGLVTFFDWYGYNRFSEGDKTSAAMLTMSTDKTHYNVGEEITLIFKAPEGSRAYVSIENGSGVMSTHQINERNNEIIFKTKATEHMAPNVYLSVSLIQPHANTIDGLPIRLYGIVPVFVDNPETILKPVIKAPQVMRPGQTASVNVSETNGKPMTYTLAIVDEGLLSLTKYRTPDPHARFYAREALGVKTWDIYKDVIGAWGGQIQRILSIGGGDDADIDASGQRATRFKPMVRFIGPVELERGKSMTHQISIPDYVGSVRIMVVAGRDRAYGNAEKNVPVRNPLMILGTAPRVIGPGESFKLPVSVFAMENHVKNVKLNIQTNRMLKVDGSQSKNLTFSKTGEQLEGFVVKAADAIGTGQIIITATSGNERAVWTIELDVRPANPMMTDVVEASISEGETWKQEFTSIGIDGTNENILEISSFIPMNIDKWLTFLLNYPHGCSEQTISGAFPMLYADKLSDASDAGMKKAESKVKQAISRIQALQLGSGGVGMWPGALYADDWTTSYAGHFLIEAQQKGYVVSKQFMNRWKSFQQKKVRNWRHDKSVYNNDLMQAYRLYTLALAGSPETGAMNRLSEAGSLSPQSKWMLASAYTIIGRTDAAKRLISNTTTQIRNYSEHAYTYGSHLRDKAFILETYLRLGMGNNARNMLQDIGSELGQSMWLSTQTAGQSLRAVALYLTYFPMGKQMNFAVNYKNKPQDFQSRNMTHRMELGKGKTESITIENKGSGTIYARIIRKGIPVESDIPAAMNNLTMKVSYTGLDGRQLNPEMIDQGTVFYANVTLTHPGNFNAYRSMALTQIFPSGWEVMSDRYAFDDYTAKNFTYQDIRDDRVITYFDLPRSGSMTFRVRLSASFAGTFYMPAVYCEAMYDNRINASVQGRWVKVVDPNEKLTSDARAGD